MAVVYQHRKKGTPDIFYIGIGNSIKRAYDTKYRNNHWTNTVGKHGFDVDVLISGISKEEAAIIEVGLIQSYGRLDLGNGILVNMTDGGEGIINAIRTKEWKSRISKALSGKPKSGSHRESLSRANVGKRHSEEWKQYMRKKMKGRKMKEADVEKIRQSKIGSKNPSARKVIDTSTGVIYGSIKEMCDQLSLKYKSTYKRISGELKNTTPYLYYSDFITI